MLEFKENRPERRRLSPTTRVAAGILAFALCAALAAVLVPRFLRGRGVAHGAASTEGASLSADEAKALLDPSDEWVLAHVAGIDFPTVANLSPLVEAAPNSLVLLRYLAAITNPRASAVVAARIVELSPRFSQPPASFGGSILWRGSRIARPRGGAEAEPPAIRHHFSIASGAAWLFASCGVRTRYLGFDGKTLAIDDFAPRKAAYTVVSYSEMRDAAEFFVERPIPEGVLASDGGWALELGVVSDGRDLPLDGDGQGATRARIDFLE